jgi:hypothetical protein
VRASTEVREDRGVGFKTRLTKRRIQRLVGGVLQVASRSWTFWGGSRRRRLIVIPLLGVTEGVA